MKKNNWVVFVHGFIYYEALDKLDAMNNCPINGTIANLSDRQIEELYKEQEYKKEILSHFYQNS